MTPQVELGMTAEDRELDRELDRIAEQAAAPDIPDPGAGENVLRREVESYELLSDYVEDYQPATTTMELENQVFQAKSLGADSIEATAPVFKVMLGKIPADPYFVYREIKVYQVGRVGISQLSDRETADSRLFKVKK